VPSAGAGPWYGRLEELAWQNKLSHAIVTAGDAVGLAPRGLKDVHNMLVNVATSSGTPTLPITLNSGSGAAAEYRSGSGTSTLVFRYTVRGGDSDSNGLAVGSAIALNGGAITSLDDGQPVVSSLTLPGISSTEGLLVDGINDAPEVSSPTLLNARYSEGDAAIRLNADLALNLPDFRAAERTLQLLVQVHPG
jgi:hypothetical protein